MTSANKVADIFCAAGEAFSRLGALAMELQSTGSDGTPGSDEGKWGDEEIEMLRQSVRRFGGDLEKISAQIKTKSVGQIRSALKQKALLQKAGSAKSTLPSADEMPTKDISQTPSSSHSGLLPSKRIRIDDSKIIVSPMQDDLILGTRMDNSSIIESALNKLKYESTKDPQADIDIEG